MPDFVIQGGCPEGIGTWRTRLQVRRRACEPPWPLQARCGRDGSTPGPTPNGSQFFICIDDCQTKLTPSYNLFGYVVDGMDVAVETKVGDVMRKVEIEEQDRGECLRPSRPRYVAALMRP